MAKSNEYRGPYTHGHRPPLVTEYQDLETVFVETSTYRTVGQLVNSYEKAGEMLAHSLAANIAAGVYDFGPDNVDEDFEPGIDRQPNADLTDYDEAEKRVQAALRRQHTAQSEAKKTAAAAALHPERDPGPPPAAGPQTPPKEGSSTI